MSLWKLIPESFILIGGILERLIFVVGGMHVDVDRMRENLGLTGGLIVSEAIMLRLAERIGRQNAHHAVSEAARLCAESKRPFKDCLAENTAIAGRVGTAELEALLKPEAYIGAAPEIVDRVLLNGRP